MQFGFGSGSLWGTNTAANSSPQEFGALQDCSIDFSFSMKELRGRFQMPLTVARGAGKIQGKAKSGNINAKLFNELFFGQAMATGKTATAQNETAAIPATPFTVTVTNGATFKKDLGVKFALTGLPLVRVASAPVTGQYSVNETTGAYLFAAADTGLSVMTTYTYTTTGGNTITLSNQLMGTTPYFSVILNEVYEGKAVTIELLKCTSDKLTIATKLEDFIIPELGFEAMANAAGIIGYLSIDE
ncbi:conserved hypothetical protein [Gammaproteobacteria bacterium]